MKLSNEKKIFLETHVFKGKIEGRFCGRGGLIYKVERDCIPKHVAYKTTQEFENEDFSTLKIESISDFEREIGNWFRHSNHPLLITPFSVSIINGFPMICMPYCNGDISYFIRTRLSFTGVLCFSLQIIKGMIEAKKSGLIHHQDIKPENILYIDLSEKFRCFPPEGVDSSLKYSLRIADFGVANAYFDGHLGGTNVYKSPEQYDATIFDGRFEPDIFSVGLVIAELFQGYHPASKNENESIKKWRESKLKRWTLSGARNYKNTENEVEVKLINLIEEMLSSDPKLRPSFESCYDFLFDILKQTDPASFKQLAAMIDNYDQVSVLNGVENKLFNLIKLSKIKSQLSSITTNISLELQALIDAHSYDPVHMVNTFHYAKALYKICNDNRLKDFDDLMTFSFEQIVFFLLESPQEITSSILHPVMNNSTTIGSDFEASSDVFNESLKYLSHLNYSGEVQSIIDSSNDDMIKAFIVFGVARDLKSSGHHLEAYQKICELRSLIPINSKFEEVFNVWERDVIFWSELRKSIQDDE